MTEAELTSAVVKAVEAGRNKTVELHRAFVQARSITGDEGRMAARTAEAFRERGLETNTWAATAEEMKDYLEHVGEQPGYEGRLNVVGRRKGAGGGRSILLNAHIDTVPEGDHALWTQDPFAANVVNGRVYGRGSCDMKGGLVTHLAALDALSAAGIRLKGDVTVAATVGEEDGGLGALSTVLRGYQADAALVTEPTRAGSGHRLRRLAGLQDHHHRPIGPRRHSGRGGLGPREVPADLCRSAEFREGAERQPQASAVRCLPQQGADQCRRGARRELGFNGAGDSRGGGAGGPAAGRGAGVVQEIRDRSDHDRGVEGSLAQDCIRRPSPSSADSSSRRRLRPTPRSARRSGRLIGV